MPSTESITQQTTPARKRRVLLGTQAMRGPAGLFDIPFDRLGEDGYAPTASGLQDVGSIRAVFPDNERPERLYAATSATGIHRSDDGGATWTPANAGLDHPEVWSLVQHPRTGVLFAGTGPAAVYRSDDRADSWQQCEGFQLLDQSEWVFPGPGGNPHVKGLALSDTDDQLVIGAVEEGWLVFSRDGGRSWENQREGVEYDAHYGLVLPGAPDTVVAASGKGCYRSTDGGRTFARSDAGMDRIYMTPVVVHPDRPQRLFTAAAEVPPPQWRRPEGASAAFYRSDDSGEHWTKLTGGVPEWFHAAPRSITTDPTDPDVVLVGLADGTLWLTEDGGDTFRCALSGLPAISSITVVAQ